MHVRIAQSYWGVVEFIVPYISRGPFVEREGKRERAIRVTFDKFLRPAVAAWKENIIKCETNIITTCVKIPHKHPSLSVFTRGYYSKSEGEIDIESDDYEFREEREILICLGYPSVPLEQS